MPFYVMIITSLKPYADVNDADLPYRPKGFYFEELEGVDGGVTKLLENRAIHHLAGGFHRPADWPS